MKEFWSEDIAAIEPYVPGEQPKGGKWIKLNTNENPYPPSPEVFKAIEKAAARLRLYPDPTCADFRLALAERFGVKKEQVCVGNGSDDVLSLAFKAFFAGKKRVQFPDISYGFYPVFAEYYKVDHEIIPLNDDFTLPVEKFRGGGGVVFANPNAPTGLAVSAAQVAEIARANPGAVVIADEAYVDFGGESAVPLTKEYKNLLVVGTLSKSYALAGLRAGYAVGDENLIAALEAAKYSVNPYSLDALALAGAAAAVRDREYFNMRCAMVIATRERTAAKLRELGFEVLPSKANFLFARFPGRSGKELFEGLRERGILVRYFAKPRTADFLRISVGTDEEMDSLCAALAEML